MESRAAAIAHVLRPLAVAVSLAALALTLRCTPDRSRPIRGDAATGIMASVVPHLELTPPANIFGPAGPVFGWSVDAAGGVLRPPALRDAQEWPRGMVIKPPSTNDRIALELAGPLDSLAARLDSLLSALLAPWSATAS
jgi:hypothetical protein